MAAEQLELHRRLTGLPEALMPGDAPSGAGAERFDPVAEGPRCLAVRPFDYRNPFAAGAPDEEIPRRLDSLHPAVDAGAAYLRNGAVILGLPGGPECALVDRCATLRAYTGALSIAWGEEGVVRSFDWQPKGHGVTSEFTEAGVCYGLALWAAAAEDLADVACPIVPGAGYGWSGKATPRGRNTLLFADCTAAPEGLGAGRAAAHLTFLQALALDAGFGLEGQGVFAPSWTQPRWEPVGHGRYRLAANQGSEAYTLALLIAPECEVDLGLTGPDPLSQPLPHAPELPAKQGAVVRKKLGYESAPLFTWIQPLLPLPTRHDQPLISFDTGAERAECAGAVRLGVDEPAVCAAWTAALHDAAACAMALEESLLALGAPSGGRPQFQEGEAAEIAHAFDLNGCTDQAEKMLAYFALRQPDLEGTGPALWAYGRHFGLTRDRTWLNRIWPDIERRMAHFARTWTDHRAENNGLLPPSEHSGGDQLDGPSVGTHAWALAGVREAVALAKAAGKDTLAAAWQGFHTDLNKAVVDALAKLVADTDGVVTPGFEGFDAKTVTQRIPGSKRSRRLTGPYGKAGGFDDGNLALVYPTGLLEPMHPWVSSSLSRWGNAYVEGLLPYPEESDFTLLAAGPTLFLSEAWLRRGDYAEALRDFYGVLLHTTSAWGHASLVDSGKGIGLGRMPDAVVAARFARFLRDCLAYEDHAQRLHLLAGLSPAWMTPGASIVLENAPTELGPLTIRGTFRQAALDLEIDLRPYDPKTPVILHLPPFLQEPRVKAGDGHADPAQGGWRLPAGSTRITAWWRDEPLPNLSLAAIAETLKREEEPALA